MDWLLIGSIKAGLGEHRLRRSRRQVVRSRCNRQRALELVGLRDHAMTIPTSTQTVAPPRGRELAALILRECERAGSPIGTRLPTERQLALTLGVTRAAVRRALGVLEAEGRVSREVGRGTFLRAAQAVHQGPEAQVARPDDVGPADVMAARELFEPQMLPLAVARATTRDFDEMERCLAGGATAESAEEFEAWDFALHRAIVVAAHNQLLLAMYAGVEGVRHGQLWGNLKKRSDSVERRTAYQVDHREIVDALRAREIDRAHDAMTQHLERVRANLLGPGL
ncbi:MAG: FCD domain-containing protein [Gaiellales bacterium]